MKFTGNSVICLNFLFTGYTHRIRWSVQLSHKRMYVNATCWGRLSCSPYVCEFMIYIRVWSIAFRVSAGDTMTTVLNPSNKIITSKHITEFVEGQISDRSFNMIASVYNNQIDDSLRKQVKKWSTVHYFVHHSRWPRLPRPLTGRARMIQISAHYLASYGSGSTVLSGNYSSIFLVFKIAIPAR